MEVCKQVKKSSVVSLSPSQRDNVNTLRHTFLKDLLLAESLFSRDEHSNCNQYRIEWDSFRDALSGWEAYCSNLVKEMVTSLPYWRAHQSIFSVSHLDTENGNLLET